MCLGGHGDAGLSEEELETIKAQLEKALVPFTESGRYNCPTLV